MHAFNSQNAQSAFVERRSKPRIQCSYPALVRGHLDSGMRYEAPAVLSNMSSVGMYLRLKRHIQTGEHIFVAVRLSTAPLGQSLAPQIAANATVVRSELLPDGTYGIGISLHHHRFL